MCYNTHMNTKEHTMNPTDIHSQIVAIERDIRAGILSFPAIARKHEVPSYFVTDVWNYMCECELDD